MGLAWVKLKWMSTVSVGDDGADVLLVGGWTRGEYNVAEYALGILQSFRNSFLCRGADMTYTNLDSKLFRLCGRSRGIEVAVAG